MRSEFSFFVLAAALVAAPAFAQNQPPAGHWDGILERNGAREPIAINLAVDGGTWRGRFEADGASSQLESLSVTGNRVHFELPGQGVFDGTFSGDSMAGSVSASGSKGSFTLTREKPREPYDAYGDAIESEGP